MLIIFLISLPVRLRKKHSSTLLRQLLEERVKKIEVTILSAAEVFYRSSLHSGWTHVELRFDTMICVLMW